MAEKKFRKDAATFKQLVEPMGGCIASDRITVDGMEVGYCYREASDDEYDSGWRFLAGDEDEAYMANTRNFAFYDVNTVANYDPDITPLLEAPEGTAFARDESGRFIAEPLITPDDE
ncbi:MAG TPA: DUF2185 domain-containing protein [Phycisphaerales bacterium]|nr:DUF2185 domain-containing protein [Phycisphaerales bacterium]